MSKDSPVRHPANDSSAALRKARRVADAATTFGIIAFVFGVIAVSVHTLGAVGVIQAITS